MAGLGEPRGLASQLEILIRRDLIRFAPLPKQSEEKANAYGIPSVPVIAVNGRYLIAVGGSPEALRERRPGDREGEGGGYGEVVAAGAVFGA